jgi:uncharacterized protein YycO
MRLLLSFSLLCILFLSNYHPSSDADLQTLQSGDLIFQTSNSGQSLAIQRATNSPYSHMGIVFEKDHALYVYEAIEPVKLTPLKKWIARGAGQHYVVKRLKNADQKLNPQVLQKMLTEGKKHQGKHYDLSFEWNDDRMYCSELVWKIYKRALDVEIGKLAKLSSFNLSDPLVKKQIKARYGDNIPLNEQVISPAAMFESDLLMTIIEL